MNRRSPKKSPQPLDADSLRNLALYYVGRYATTRAKLRGYLRRKVRERGWDGSGEPDFVALAERLSELGYIDDRGYAESRARSLARRGYGPQRVAQAFHAAGIVEEDSAAAREFAESRSWEAALVFARKRRIGPFAEHPAPAEKRRRLITAMMRAGHSFELAIKIVDAAPGEMFEDRRS